MTQIFKFLRLFGVFLDNINYIWTKKVEDQLLAEEVAKHMKTCSLAHGVMTHSSFGKDIIRLIL